MGRVTFGAFLEENIGALVLPDQVGLGLEDEMVSSKRQVALDEGTLDLQLVMAGVPELAIEHIN